jgi:hypothetical protein
MQQARQCALGAHALAAYAAAMTVCADQTGLGARRTAIIRGEAKLGRSVSAATLHRIHTTLNAAVGAGLNRS